MYGGPREEGGERLGVHRKSAGSVTILAGRELDRRAFVPLGQFVIVGFKARHKTKY